MFYPSRSVAEIWRIYGKESWSCLRGLWWTIPHWKTSCFVSSFHLSLIWNSLAPLQLLHCLLSIEKMSLLCPVKTALLLILHLHSYTVLPQSFWAHQSTNINPWWDSWYWISVMYYSSNNGNDKINNFICKAIFKVLSFKSKLESILNQSNVAQLLWSRYSCPQRVSILRFVSGSTLKNYSFLP